jgi:hypothetical protein
VPVLCALLLGLWVQSNLFVWDYGVFDGTRIDWSDHSGKGVLELLVWLGGLAFALIWPGVLERNALLLVFLVLLLQLVSVANGFHQGGPYPPHKATLHGDAQPQESAAGPTDRVEAMLQFSRERNVIVIVLDTLQSDFYAELLTDPEFAAAVPQGFTYYRNAVAPYPATALSLPSILTSQTPVRQASPALRSEQMKRSAPALLARDGWGSSLLTFSPQYFNCRATILGVDCLSHIAYLAELDRARVGAGAAVDRIEDARSMLRLALFRSAPHFLKPRIYDAGIWRVPDPFGARQALDGVDQRIGEKSRRDIAIMRSLIGGATANSPVPTFKLLHLFGVHHPGTLTHQCGWNGIANPEYEKRISSFGRARTESIDASRCTLTLVHEFLQVLDQKGVLEASLVFILGDHGRADTPVDLAVADPPIPEPQGRSRKPQLVQAMRGLPLFLMKPVGARGPLQISDAAVSLCDVPNTIREELGMKASFQCESVIRAREGRAALRQHFRISSQHDSDHHAPFDRYLVSGHSWLENSWVPDSAATPRP